MREHYAKLVLARLRKEIINVAVEIVGGLVDIEEGGAAFPFGKSGTFKRGLQCQGNKKAAEE